MFQNFSHLPREGAGTGVVETKSAEAAAFQEGEDRDCPEVEGPAADNDHDCPEVDKAAAEGTALGGSSIITLSEMDSSTANTCLGTSRKGK